MVGDPKSIELAAKVLIIISIVFSAIAIFFLFILSYFLLLVLVFIPKFVGIIIFFVLIAKIAGLVLACLSFGILKRDSKKAGIFLIISSLLPPLDFFALIAGILALSKNSS